MKWLRLKHRWRRLKPVYFGLTLAMMINLTISDAGSQLRYWVLQVVLFATLTVVEELVWQIRLLLPQEE